MGRKECRELIASSEDLPTLKISNLGEGSFLDIGEEFGDK
jgi:hypothetical protein